MKATTTFSLKDQLFNKDKVTYLAELFQEAYSQFSSDAFIKSVVDAFPELELKQRITHITEQLNAYLPDDYSDA
ncbi:MAG: DNA alkylation repair protein, partial [Deinococcota bacterium]